MYRILRNKLAFTLIELLIVVAIIAILAAIAVPNFMEAQVRAKVSRAKSDMRSISVAIESYSVDHNRSPVGQNEGTNNRLNWWVENNRHYCFNAFTSPVSYMSSVPPDPFAGVRLIKTTAGRPRPFLKYYEYQCYYGSKKYNAKHKDAFALGYTWYLRSNGPDGLVGEPHFVQSVLEKNFNNIYDSTNGTKSYGVIYLCNKGFLDQGGM